MAELNPPRKPNGPWFWIVASLLVGPWAIGLLVALISVVYQASRFEMVHPSRSSSSHSSTSDPAR